MKKILFFLFTFVFGLFLICEVNAGTHVAKYNKTLSRNEKEAICRELQNASQVTPSERNGLGGGVIPDEVLTNLYNTTRNISNSISLVSVLGDALMCHAVHGGKNKAVEIGLLDFPDIPTWLCGAIIYFFGFMLVLSITFYVVDISFKLGFAIILMPIGVALWPFEKTRDKIVMLISIFLKSAAILAFLSITVAYTVTMLSESLSGLKEVFEAITLNDTDYIDATFSLGSVTFLIVVTSLVYGMKLIQSTIPQYVDKFFPDKAFRSASPMHHLSTQAMDFAKKKVVDPVATFAGNVAETQIGKGVEKVGKFARFGYHKEVVSGIKNIGVAVRNPKQTLQKTRLAVIHGAQKAGGSAQKGLNNLKSGAEIALASLVAGKDNRKTLRDKIRNERDEKNERINDVVAKNYNDAKQDINETIQRREQFRADEKQRIHEDKMLHDPAYREKFLKKQQKAEEKEEQERLRQDRIDALDGQLRNIDLKKQIHQLDTKKFYQNMNNFADKIKDGKGTARLLRSIQNTKDNALDKINTGMLASKAEDDALTKGLKSVVRNTQKAIVSLGLGAIQAPLGIVSGTVNLGIEAVNTGIKMAGGALMGTYNSAVGVAYGIRKVVPGLEKAVRKLPDTLLNVAKTPGTIIEETGKAMQHHKRKK